MTYPDKEGSDFALVPVLEIMPSTVHLETEGKLLQLFGPDKVLSGVDRITGRVTLVLTETLSGERMWFKSIEIPDTTVSWKSKRLYNDQRAAQLERTPQLAGITLAQLEDPGYLNPMSKALEHYYQVVLKRAWDYLSPREMASLKKMADDLKDKYRVGQDE